MLGILGTISKAAKAASDGSKQGLADASAAWADTSRQIANSATESIPQAGPAPDWEQVLTALRTPVRS